MYKGFSNKRSVIGEFNKNGFNCMVKIKPDPVG